MTDEQLERFVKVTFGPDGEILGLEQRNAGPAELFAASGITQVVAEMHTATLLQGNAGSGLVTARAIPQDHKRKVQ